MESERLLVCVSDQTSARTRELFFVPEVLFFFLNLQMARVKSVKLPLASADITRNQPGSGVTLTGCEDINEDKDRTNGGVPRSFSVRRAKEAKQLSDV